MDRTKMDSLVSVLRQMGPTRCITGRLRRLASEDRRQFLVGLTTRRSIHPRAFRRRALLVISAYFRAMTRPSLPRRRAAKRAAGHGGGHIWTELRSRASALRGPEGS